MHECLFYFSQCKLILANASNQCRAFTLLGSSSGEHNESIWKIFRKLFFFFYFPLFVYFFFCARFLLNLTLMGVQCDPGASSTSGDNIVWQGPPSIPSRNKQSWLSNRIFFFMVIRRCFCRILWFHGTSLNLVYSCNSPAFFFSFLGN